MLEDNEAFSDIVGEHLDPIICMGFANQMCTKSVDRRFTVICPRCTMLRDYIFCEDHSRSMRSAVSMKFNVVDPTTGCDHMDHDPRLDSPLGIAFILMEETMLNGK